ncbi:MAG: hypothetical protein M3017_04240 [Actinomycetota bacterium]|nr:hypothetical protein [Actinomycetota bacterium]
MKQHGHAALWDLIEKWEDIPNNQDSPVKVATQMAYEDAADDLRASLGYPWLETRTEWGYQDDAGIRHILKTIDSGSIPAGHHLEVRQVIEVSPWK